MLFHYFTLAGSFVIDSAKVEKAVGKDAVKLAYRILVKLLGIRGDGIERDVNIAAHHLALAVIKRDDVRVIIVLEKFAIDGENSLVVGQDVGQSADLLAVGGRNLRQPLLNQLLNDNLGELYVFS